MEYVAKRRTDKYSKRRAKSEAFFTDTSYSASHSTTAKQTKDQSIYRTATDPFDISRLSSQESKDDSVFKEEDIPNLSRKMRKSLSVSQSGRVKSRTRNKLTLFPEEQVSQSPRDRSQSVPNSFDALFGKSTLTTVTAAEDKPAAKDDRRSLDSRVSQMHAPERQVPHTDKRILCDLAF